MDAPLTFLTGEAGIEQAAKLLQGGQCVAAPTETVYGLAADAFNEQAVRDIFAIKNRPFLDPLIVHIHAAEQLNDLTRLNEAQLIAVNKLADTYWPGPLTLVLPKQAHVLDLVTANRDSVAVRCPAHPVMQALLQQSRLFLAAPSANPFGYISPTTAQHVRDSLGERCPHILDGGACEKGVESTILDLRDAHRPRLLRPGPIGREALESVLGSTVGSPSPEESPTLAPGQLERHYSPATPLVLHPQCTLPSPAEHTARISLQRPQHPQAGDFWLSESGSLDEAASNLFTLLRGLDQQTEIRTIHCEMPPSGPGVADAIRDRLSRASKR